MVCKMCGRKKTTDRQAALEDTATLAYCQDALDLEHACPCEVCDAHQKAESCANTIIMELAVRREKIERVARLKLDKFAIVIEKVKEHWIKFHTEFVGKHYAVWHAAYRERVEQKISLSSVCYEQKPADDGGLYVQ